MFIFVQGRMSLDDARFMQLHRSDEHGWAGPQESMERARGQRPSVLPRACLHNCALQALLNINRHHQPACEALLVLIIQVSILRSHRLQCFMRFSLASTIKSWEGATATGSPLPPGNLCLTYN